MTENTTVWSTGELWPSQKPRGRKAASPDEELERTVLNKPVHELPGQRHGTANKKPARPKVRAREQKLPGKSMRAERAAAERAATERNEMADFEALMAELDAQMAPAMREARQEARQRKLQRELRYGRNDFTWMKNPDSGEREYMKYWDKEGLAWS